MTDAPTVQACLLGDYDLARVQGADATAFLQAQLINDVRRVSPGHSQLSGWCNPKGRLLAVLRLFLDETSWYLRLPAEIAAPTLQRLRMFVLRSKVTIQPLQEGWSGLGVWGAQTGPLLAAAGLGLPEAIGAVTWQEGLVVLQVPGEVQRFEIWGPAERMETVRGRLDALGVEAAPRAEWALQEIRAGVPEIHAATREQFVPQTLNMDLIGALSFTKGCYPGQEIVARTRYLGRLKRRMYRLRADTGTSQPGQPVFRPERSTTDPAGTVVRWAPVADGGLELLASLRIEDATTGGLRLGAVDGPDLKPLPLPYPITAEQDP